MGVVYRVFDRQRETEVALKTLLNIDGDSIFRLKREFRSLAEVFHPNIVQLHELFFESDVWFFTMELVEGKHFLQYTRNLRHLIEGETQRQVALPPSDVSAAAAALPTVTLREPQLQTDYSFDEAKVRRVIAQLVEALSVLHSAGVLHCDIKPSNVMITTDGRVVLLDFGLATRQHLLDSYNIRHKETTSGTPAYMSPEQAAGQVLTEASDWYSVGAMLYEAITGTLPVSGNTAAEIVVRKQHVDPIPPQSLVANLPADLSELCMRMLQRDATLRPTGKEILAALGIKPARPAVPLSAASSFVGRESELATMHNALRHVQGGGSARIYLQAPSGLGKSALAERFLNDVVTHDKAVVLVGRCYQRESVPHKAIDSLVDSLCQYLAMVPEVEAAALMPRDVQVLARMFPSLLQVDAVAAAPRRDRNFRDLQELRQRGIAALKELLARITDRRPLVLFVDDLQWGDLDSAYALGELQGPPDPPAMLFLLAYRANELADNAVLRALVATDRLATNVRVETVDLHPLNNAESMQLARQLFTRANVRDEKAIDAMVREAQGSPFFVGQIAQYVASGASLQNVELKNILAARIRSLPEHAQELLRIIAVAGKRIPYEVAVDAAGLAKEADSLLNILSTARLIQSHQSPNGTAVECYHDRVREFVVDELEPRALRESHRRIAECLEQRDQKAVDALTFHWRGAGDNEKTAHYAALAASQAMDAFAFDRAAELYRLILESGIPNDEQAREVRIQLGDALQYAGSCVAAARTYLTAVEGASARTQLELTRRAAEQFMISGHYEEGRKSARSVLESVRIRWPRTTLRAVLSLVYHRARLKLRGIRYRLASKDSLVEESLDQIDAIWSMVMGLSMVDIVRGAAFTTRGLRSALDIGEPRRMCMLMTAQAGHALLEGNRRDGLRLLEAAERLAHDADDSTANGNIAMVTAASYLYQGKWREAREQSDKAVEYLREECLGMSWQISNMHLASHIASFYLGDFRELTKRVPQREQEAKDRGNLYSVCALSAQLGLVAWLAKDDVATAREKVRSTKEQLTSESFHLQHLWVLLGECMIDLYEGYGDAAWERFAAARKKLERSFVLQVELFRFMATVHLRAGCALAAATTPQRLREAERAAKKIARFPIAGSAPLAALTRASIAAKRSKRALATSLLEDAVRGFREAEMTLFAAAAQRRLGELQADAALIATANETLIAHGATNPERATAMLAPGFTP